MLAKASTLRRKHNLEEQEAQLIRESENLEFQTALVASGAKIKILDKFEGLHISARTSSCDGMNLYVGLNPSSHTHRQAVQGKDIQPIVQRLDGWMDGWMSKRSQCEFLGIAPKELFISH